MVPLAETQVEAAVCLPPRCRHGSLAVQDPLGRQTHRYDYYPWGLHQGPGPVRLIE